MRRLREALISSGLARSAGVIELMMPSMRAIDLSGAPDGICAAALANCAGSLSIIAVRPPIFFICTICSRKSSRSKSLPDFSFFASSTAFSWSTPFCASSISDSTSPMPRMREAIRSGWKGSIPVSFSPIPAYLIGRPVTWRTDKAAPPRESPSSLVRMTPVSGSASLKARAVLTASWPSIASTTNRVSIGFSAACSSAISRIIASSIARRPAVSTRSTSW